MAIRLHLGCGAKNLDGWIHIDAQTQPHLNYKTTIDNLWMFKDNTVDEIYACHVLEHVGRKEVAKVIQEWNRVLKKGGIVRISVPDWDAVVEHYQTHKSIQDIMGLVVGGQLDQFDYHCVLFNLVSMKQILMDAGFTDVSRYDWKDFLPSHFDDYSRCYLPHMDFENGRLMALNITAVKL
jgi:predicted SAM-dependent methyltransferase